MATLGSGQFTIVDQNDSVPISSLISSSPGTQQILGDTQSGQTAAVPNWALTPWVVLSANIFAGTVTNQAALGTVSSANWYLNDPSSSALTNTSDWPSGTTTANATFAFGTNNSTLTFKKNLTTLNPSATFYYKATYTDPNTNLATAIIASVSLGGIRTGTTATYVLVTGSDAFVNAPVAGSLYNTVELDAALYRGVALDTDSVTYQWYKWVTSAYVSLGTGYANIANYVFKDSAGTTLSKPAQGNFSNAKKLVIPSNDVDTLDLFKIEIKSGDAADLNVVYYQTFTIADQSDPYTIKIISSAGDKFLGSAGASATTNLTMTIWKGATELTTTTTTGEYDNCTYTWTMKDRDGEIAAFWDGSSTQTAGTSGPATGGNTLPFGTAPSAQIANGNIVKIWHPSYPNYHADYKKILSVGTSTTIDTADATYNGVFSQTWPAGTLVKRMLASKVGNSGTGTARRTITITGDDIDVQGTIFCTVTA